MTVIHVSTKQRSVGFEIRSETPAYDIETFVKMLMDMNRIDVGICLAHLYVCNKESFAFFRAPSFFLLSGQRLLQGYGGKTDVVRLFRIFDVRRPLMFHEKIDLVFLMIVGCGRTGGAVIRNFKHQAAFG